MKITTCFYRKFRSSQTLRPLAKGVSMLQSIINSVTVPFALIGLVALVRWVFRTNWHIGYKAAALFVGVFFGSAILSAPLAGVWGQNHGTLVALFATGGLVIALIYGFRRTNDWRWQAGFVTASLLLMAVMWQPVYSTGLPGLPVPSSGGQSGQSWTGPSIQNQPGQRSDGRREPTEEECEKLPYESRITLGCP